MKAILLAGGLSLILTLIGTRYAIRFLSGHGYGQLIRDDGPTTHHTKRGTPTMGGLVIVLAAVVSYFVAKLITGVEPSASALLLLLLFVGLGTVGFLDDFIKIYKQRNLGLRSWAKIVGQTTVAVVFGWLSLSPWFTDEHGYTPASHHISFIRDLGEWTVPTVLMIIFIALLAIGSSNAVNLTDGLDGLGTAAALPVRRTGHGRLPRRLHQDLQAAHPRAAQQGEVHRPDRHRGGVRRSRPAPAAQGRTRPDPCQQVRLLH
ncbi:MAG: hypothetical protein ACRDPH_14020, partial [Marmoricola sp.]